MTAAWVPPVAETTVVRSQRFLYALIAIAMVILAALVAAIFVSRRPSRDVQSSATAKVQGADSCVPASKSVVDQDRIGMTMVFQRAEAGEFGDVKAGRPLTLMTSTSLGKLVQVEQLSEYSIRINSKQLELERSGQRQIFTLQGTETFSREDEDCIVRAGKRPETGPINEQE